MYDNKSQHKYFRSFSDRMQACFPVRNSVAAMPATLRFLHASPELPPVDIFLDGRPVLQNFHYKSSTTYINLPSGQYQFDFYPAGESAYALISKKVHIQAGKCYTLAAAGKSDNHRILKFEDQHDVPAKEAKIRFIHLFPGIKDIDIAVKSRDVIFQKIPYRNSTSYLGVTPMVLNLEARIAGTSEVICQLPEIKLKPDRAYTAFLVGLTDDEHPIELILLRG